MIAKTFANATKGAFRNFLKVTDSKKELKPFYVIDLKNKYDCYPFTFAGTILKTDILKQHNVNTSLGLEIERDFFLRFDGRRNEGCISSGCGIYSIRI